MDVYTWDDLCADLSSLIEDGLVAVTGKFPDFRFCLTPEAESTLRWYDDHDREVATEARELQMRRHAAAQEGNVIQLFGDPSC
jgi:hypothetical protein